jgi:dipeptidyl aminopeptidase/acylaminoacyl peptidase
VRPLAPGESAPAGSIRWFWSASVLPLTALALVAAVACSVPESDQESASAVATEGYRRPSRAIEELLTAQPPPKAILHSGSGRVALLFREPVIDLERLSRARLGLAGYRFDPVTGTSSVEPLVDHLEVVEAGPVDENSPSGPGTRVEWRPRDPARLDHVEFSPDGRLLKALIVADGPARIALFDVATGEERVLPTPVNAAWGDPCSWVGSDSLLCRVFPAHRPPAPLARPVPEIIEHRGGPAPTRTYSNLLESAHEEALFEHWFGVELARVDLSGRSERLAVTPGLISNVEPSPDGTLAVLTRIERPYSHLVPARQFPSVVELWDLSAGQRLYASSPSGFDVTSDETDADDPRRAVWRPRDSSTLGWIQRTSENGAFRGDRWLTLQAPFPGEPREVARSDRPIRVFGWTTAGTPYYTTRSEDGAGVDVFVVFEDGPRKIWSSVAGEGSGNPGRALRVDGDRGPVLEVDGRIFLAGEGLSSDGPSPFLDVYDLRSGRTDRVFSAEPGVFEVVIGLLDPDAPVLLTSRETETEPPNLYSLRGATRTALRPFPTPYPALSSVTRRVVRYTRADGVALSGSLYLPEGASGGPPLPTLVWIYPYEFSDREQAEQMDVRSFQFHKVKGPSPLAALLAGYAVLLNPTVPILQEGSGATDDYLPQLVASAEAAVDHLVEIGVADPDRIAVAGRSYGAFSSANLVIHSRYFATAIAMSGAYNRTLTPFGFQHEKRSFWDATGLYMEISPFFHANRIEVPVLLVHGAADENPGTPPLQARRFAHALVGEGVPVRYVELPYEGHHYWARESVLDAAAEMIDWLDRTIGPGAKGARQGPGVRPAP